MTFQGWAIDRDYLSEGDEVNRVGYGMKLADAEATEDSFNAVIGRRVTVTTGLKASDVEDPIRFRALDDDGEVYYGGAVTRDWLLGEEDHAYMILKFAEADAGATDVQFRASDLPEAMVERHRQINCVVKSGDTEWVVIYG